MHGDALYRWFRQGASGHRAAAAIALALCLLVAAGLRIVSLQFDYHHPDEVISVRVAETVLATGKPDTNWVHAGLPRYFNYPQYNFSGYLLAAAGMLTLKPWFGGVMNTLEWLRSCSALLGTLAVFLTYLAGRRLFGNAAALCASGFVAIHPLLYQDSLYARPESFVTVLTLLLVCFAAAPARKSWVPGLAAGFVFGVLLATKVSMLLLAPVLLLAVIRMPQAGDRGRPGAIAWLAQAWESGKWIPLSVLAGFAAGVPYALVHPTDFLDGIEVLRAQYGTAHFPYGMPEGGTLPRLAHAGVYLHATTGWLIPLAFAGGAAAVLRREYRALPVLLAAGVTLFQFSTYSVFFERNLSHVMPLLAIFAGYALATLAAAVARWRFGRAVMLAAGFGLVALPSIGTTAKLRWHELPGKQYKQLVRARIQLQKDTGIPLLELGWVASMAGVHEVMRHRCDGPMLVEMIDVGEANSGPLLRQLQAEGFVEVGRLESTFTDLPTSTLQTYFTPTRVFMYRPSTNVGCRLMGRGFASPASAGEPLPILALEADAAWTRGGAYDDTPPPFGKQQVLGSWSGSDANEGHSRLTVSVKGVDMLVLPYITGPVAARQSLTVRDAADGRVLMRSEPAPATSWRLTVVRVPPGIEAVRIEGHDGGTGWGEWQAFGIPRRLKEP